MKRAELQLAALAALSFMAAACNCGVAVDPEGFVCSPGGVCPAGYECIANVCRASGGTGGGTAGSGGAGGGNATGGGAGGGSALCAGVTCNMPPAATCNGNMLRTFAGQCNGGTGLCEYQPMDTACPNGCMNGQCTGSTCTGVTCTTPPPPSCSGNNVITYSLPGECKDGTCRYMEANASCPNGCANGACVPMGATFTQVLPRVKHQITAVDQRPGSAGDDVLVVGPAGAASRWNGTQWSPLATGMNGNLTSVWFSGANSAFIVAETGLLRMTSTGVARVASFPAIASGTKLVDVHGISETNLAVVDATGTVYRWRAGAWATNSGSDGGRDAPPYRMSRVLMEPSAGSFGARLRYIGACGSPTLGGCVVYQDDDGSYYDDRDNATAAFRSVAPSLDLTGQAWLGLDIPQVRRHNTTGTFDSNNTPTGLDGGVVTAMTGSSLSAVRATYILTAPEKQLGHLYRASGVALTPTVDHLMEVLYGYQAMSKNESGGVIVVDMNTVSNTSTITRRGIITNEVLDLGAEDWVAGAAHANGSVLLNPFGDVALRTNGSATFQVRRFPFDLTATDVAAGTTYALVVADDGTAWRLPYASNSTFTEVTFTQKSAGLTAVCRASDTEWYLAGKAGALFGYDGAMTRQLTSGTTASLEDVDCPAAGVAVACGAGTVLRLNAGTWAPVPMAPAGSITSCTLAMGAIWVAGPGLFARFANGAWQTLPSRPVLDGLVVRSVNEAYAVSGTSVVRWDGTAWTSIATAPQSLKEGFLMGTRMAFVGSGGVVMEGQ